MKTITRQENNAVIYCRVSSKEQVEEGNSLITQERVCLEYASKHGYNVVKRFIEQGESAKSTERKELQKLLKYCSLKKNKVSVLIAYKIDRISRNMDDYSQIRMMLKHYNVDIRSTSEHLEDTPSGRFMENILANVAQFDNDVRTERSINGMIEACSEGRYVWMSPIGYDNVRINGKCTIAPNVHGKYIKMAFQMAAEKLKSRGQIKQWLEEQGVKTRTGKPLSLSSVYSILQNPVYYGEFHKFGKLYKGSYEKLITKEAFLLANTKMNQKEKRKVYCYENEDFPLRRFVTDYDTGKNLTGGWSTSRSGKRYPYYRCHPAKKNYTKGYLETRFEKFINRFRVCDHALRNLQDYVARHIKGSAELKFDYKERLQKEIDALKERQTLILDDRYKGYITPEVMKNQIDILELQIAEKQFEVDKPINQLDMGYIIDRIERYLRNPYLIWKNLNIDAKIALQWFEFPDGISFDGENFRTTKTALHFKLNEFISILNSRMVPSKKSDLNKAQMTNLIYHNKDPGKVDDEVIPYLYSLHTEFKRLDQIVASEKT